MSDGERTKIGDGYASDPDSIITGYNRMRTGLILMLMRYGAQTFTRDEALAVLDSGQRYPIHLNMGDEELNMSVEKNEEHSRTQ